MEKKLKSQEILISITEAVKNTKEYKEVLESANYSHYIDLINNKEKSNNKK